MHSNIHLKKATIDEIPDCVFFHNREVSQKNK